MDNCILCGAALVEGKCPNEEQHIKRMCLNCIFCENGTCTNEENKEAATKKILSTIQMPAGYELEGLAIKPVPLKDATKKCSKHEVNFEAIQAALMSILK